MLIYVIPLCLRLSDPTQVVLIMVGAIATWKSYPSLGDMALWAGLLSCFPEIVASEIRCVVPEKIANKQTCAIRSSH